MPADFPAIQEVERRPDGRKLHPAITAGNAPAAPDVCGTDRAESDQSRGRDGPRCFLMF